MTRTRKVSSCFSKMKYDRSTVVASLCKKLYEVPPYVIINGSIIKVNALVLVVDVNDASLEAIVLLPIVLPTFFESLGCLFLLKRKRQQTSRHGKLSLFLSVDQNVNKNGGQIIVLNGGQSINQCVVDFELPFAIVAEFESNHLMQLIVKESL